MKPFSLDARRMRPLALLLLIPLLARAADINFPREEELGKIVAFLAKLGNFNVVVDPVIARNRMSFSVVNVQPLEALQLVAKIHDYKVLKVKEIAGKETYVIGLPETIENGFEAGAARPAGPHPGPTADAAGGGRSVPSRSAIEAAMQSVFPALVRVQGVLELPSSGRLSRGEVTGSGVIITPDGYVVTNHHVAGHAVRITCTLANRQTAQARLVGSDALADIAVLKIDASKLPVPVKVLPFARWGDSDKLRVGECVLAMGSPGALSQTVTCGIVANARMVSTSRASGLGGPPTRPLPRSRQATFSWKRRDTPWARWRRSGQSRPRRCRPVKTRPRCL